MATKAGLLATINGFITALINVTKHRSSMSAVVDEMYATEVVDSNVSQTYTNYFGALTYNIKLRKSGNAVILSGTITNPTNRFISNEVVFSFKTTDFKPKADTANLAFGGNFEIQENPQICYLAIRLNLFILSSQPISPNSTILFNNIIYITEP